MSSPPEHRRASSRPPTGGGTLVKAGALLVVFVVITVLTLRVIHPDTASTAGHASTPTIAPNTSTTTTSPAAPTTTTSTTPPAQVSVVVANASGVTGAAAAVSARLHPGGWNLLPAVNATASSATSHVYYVAGREPSAIGIATALHLAASVVAPYTTAVPISAVGTAQVVVIVGTDVADAPASTTASTVG